MNKVMVCCPGTSFTSRSIICISNLLKYFLRTNAQYNFSFTFSRNIYETRNKCLMGLPEGGKDQKPFNGNEYTHILWLDDDVLFNTSDVEKLFDADKDVVSGLYLMSDRENYAVVEKWDENYFNQNGSFEFLDKKTLAKKEDLFKVSYVGFGFLLIKRGIFEQFEYPWFDPRYLQIKSSTDFCMEDVSFCLKCKDKDIPIYVHPEVKVIHRKPIHLK